METTLPQEFIVVYQSWSSIDILPNYERIWLLFCFYFHPCRALLILPQGHMPATSSRVPVLMLKEHYILILQEGEAYYKLLCAHCVHWSQQRLLLTYSVDLGDSSTILECTIRTSKLCSIAELY